MRIRIDWTVTHYESATVEIDPQAIRDAGYDPASEAQVHQWARTELKLPEAQAISADEYDFLAAEVLTD